MSFSTLRNRRRNGERGAVLVEAAIISPILLVVVFGIFEFSLLFRTHLTVANMARDGARAASAYGRDLDADKRIIETMLASGAAIDENEIEYIVIYRAENPTDGPQASCANGNANSGRWACNVYRPSDWQNTLLWDSGTFGCNTPHLDKHYCPTSRDTEIDALGFIGVYIKTRHSSATGLFGTTNVITDQVVLRFEPDPDTGP